MLAQAMEPSEFIQTPKNDNCELKLIVSSEKTDPIRYSDLRPTQVRLKSLLRRVMAQNITTLPGEEMRARLIHRINSQTQELEQIFEKRVENSDPSVTGSTAILFERMYGLWILAANNDLRKMEEAFIEIQDFADASIEDLLRQGRLDLIFADIEYPLPASDNRNFDKIVFSKKIIRKILSRGRASAGAVSLISQIMNGEFERLGNLICFRNTKKAVNLQVTRLTCGEVDGSTLILTQTKVEEKPSEYKSDGSIRANHPYRFGNEPPGIEAILFSELIVSKFFRSIKPRQIERANHLLQLIEDGRFTIDGNRIRFYDSSSDEVFLGKIEGKYVTIYGFMRRKTISGK